MALKSKTDIEKVVSEFLLNSCFNFEFPLHIREKCCTRIDPQQVLINLFVLELRVACLKMKRLLNRKHLSNSFTPFSNTTPFQASVELSNEHTLQMETTLYEVRSRQIVLFS